MKHLPQFPIANLAVLLALSLTVVTFSSCKDDNDKAEKLMEEIRANYKTENYEQCIKGVDSLRVTFPKAIEARKEALKIYQDASLKMAQNHLADVDQRLQRAETSCDSLTAVVSLHKQQGSVTAPELQQLNKKKALRDSLKAIFDVECSKIKYIHKKQKEM